MRKESTVQFDYPSMQDLGQLAFCRVWHDHKWNDWYLDKAEVTTKESHKKITDHDGPWEFPCHDWVKDETRPVPAEVQLPVDSHGNDGLLDLMERKYEADLEHKLSQELGLTELEVNLFSTSRDILKRKLHSKEYATIDEERAMLPVDTEAEDLKGMSTVQISVKTATKTLETDTSKSRNWCAVSLRSVCTIKSSCFIQLSAQQLRTAHTKLEKPTTMPWGRQSMGNALKFLLSLPLEK